MDFDVLPGPSLAELARTAMDRAASAAVGCGAHEGACHHPPVTLPIRADAAGHPVLFACGGSPLARRLAEEPVAVTVTVPAGFPYSGLRVTGDTLPPCGDGAGHAVACPVFTRTVEFTGPRPALVTPGEYHAAAPDPLWREAPGILRHLEDGHMAEVLRCVRANGMPAAEWAVPRGLDRFGFQFLVLTSEGAAPVRLSFPGGPITSLRQLPASIRAVLTCHCQGPPDQPGGHPVR